MSCYSQCCSDLCRQIVALFLVRSGHFGNSISNKRLQVPIFANQHLKTSRIDDSDLEGAPGAWARLGPGVTTSGQAQPRDKWVIDSVIHSSTPRSLLNASPGKAIYCWHRAGPPLVPLVQTHIGHAFAGKQSPWARCARRPKFPEPLTRSSSQSSSSSTALPASSTAHARAVARHKAGGEEVVEVGRAQPASARTASSTQAQGATAPMPCRRIVVRPPRQPLTGPEEERRQSYEPRLRTSQRKPQPVNHAWQWSTAPRKRGNLATQTETRDATPKGTWQRRQRHRLRHRLHRHRRYMCTCAGCHLAPTPCACAEHFGSRSSTAERNRVRAECKRKRVRARDATPTFTQTSHCVE